jgi:hypothetical protein
MTTKYTKGMIPAGRKASWEENRKLFRFHERNRKIYYKNLILNSCILMIMPYTIKLENIKVHINKSKGFILKWMK